MWDKQSDDVLQYQWGLLTETFSPAHPKPAPHSTRRPARQSSGSPMCSFLWRFGADHAAPTHPQARARGGRDKGGRYLPCYHRQRQQVDSHRLDHGGEPRETATILDRHRWSRHRRPGRCQREGFRDEHGRVRFLKKEETDNNEPPPVHPHHPHTHTPTQSELDGEPFLVVDILQRVDGNRHRG